MKVVDGSVNRETRARPTRLTRGVGATMMGHAPADTRRQPDEDAMADDTREFKSFEEFWPFYLSEHLHPTSRAWHFAGITTGIIVGVALIAIGRWYLVPLSLVPGYLFAWVGHFGYEKNIPASFSQPWLSLLGDLNMYWRTLTGRIARDYETHKVAIANYAAIQQKRKAERAAAQAIKSA
jgi:hypothetical protein